MQSKESTQAEESTKEGPGAGVVEDGAGVEAAGGGSGAPARSGRRGGGSAGGGGRAGRAIGAALLLACGGLVGYGLVNTEEKPKPRAVPTVEVTYEVTGEGRVEISYLAPGGSGTATVVRDARLPWRAAVQVPLGQEPTVAITLGEEGGRAVCTLAIRGEHVQLATASGKFGRATCAGALPVAEN
ncbi:hypothetical protein Q5762_17150 [Streptomyces sp. P9(2023)]|uniref:hypothetical protein n=1 Tax=Streptomyces sp. P9(2023) TaxID=3064394 RepID=UPI0028F44EF7|nr:hypothetical protein [Streptomyces sp. P9(2023)]MDT9690030.1 hypothetical protein [Streptomyces sp. P9(2023)]